MNNKFNNEQIEAIDAPGNGPILVLAGAGTGKTTVLTQRVYHLINNLLFNENEILAITFTNKAAFEMKERLESKNININWIGTFHSIAIKMLRREIHNLNRKNDFKIIDQEDAMRIIKEIYEINGINNQDLTIKNALYYIDNIKSKYICIGANREAFNDYVKTHFKLKVYSETFIKIWEEYEKKLQKMNYLDFNDILSFMVHILENYNETRRYWINKFQYVLIDEFQDTNNIQYSFIKLILNNDKNIFVVGDGDQSIYSFRGANTEIVNKFAEEMKAKIIILNQNYRSTQPILDVSNSLIKNNKNRFSKELISINKKGKKPLFYNAWNQEIESKWIINKILELVNNGDKYNDNVVLIRSNYLSRSIEQELVLNNIPYKIYGGIKFYQRAEIKDLIAYLSVIWNYDEISIKRIINIPNRKIGDATIQEIEKKSLKENKSFFEALLDHNATNISSIAHKAIDNFIILIEEIKKIPYKSINELLEYIINKIDYIGYKNKKDPERINIIKENIQELKNGIESFEKQNINNNLGEYLQNISFFNENNKSQNDDFVSVMTIHTSKGLEFKNVFISSFNENIFPTAKSIEDGINGLEEERRVAYVALTRAKENLFISCNSSKDFIFKTNKKHSRFIDEIGLDKLDIYKPKMQIKSNIDLDWYDSNNKGLQNIFLDNYNNEQKNDYQIGDNVTHIQFGLGVVVGINNEILEIEFKKPYGIKKIIFNHKSIKRKFS